MAAGTIYKLLTQSEWEDARADGVYRGSSHDWRDGFIHFSTAAQLAGTARKYFAGAPDLVLLAVDVEGLESYPSPRPSPARGEGALLRAPHSQSEAVPCSTVPSPLAGEGQDEGGLLRWEPARGGDLFPHLYGDLPLDAVKSVTAITLGEDGIPIISSDIEP